MTVQGPSKVTISETFSSEIRAELARTRMGQHRLADELGISRATLSRRLRGHTEWPLDDAFAAASVLGLPISSLLGGQRGAA